MSDKQKNPPKDAIMGRSKKIDLDAFCADDDQHPQTHTPFSIGEYTYATNGHYCVRVPRRPGVPEVKDAPDASKLFGSTNGLRFYPLAPLDLPAAEMTTCNFCDGRGTEHDCPNCRCLCEYCDGDGKLLVPFPVEIVGAQFSSEYVRMLLALPGLLVNKTNASANDLPAQMLCFRFDGGEGRLMSFAKGTAPAKVRATLLTDGAGKPRPGAKSHPK